MRFLPVYSESCHVNSLRFCRQILVLRHAMEAATAEREREIAALQADLGSVRSELDHWRNAAAKYEEEISLLQEAFTQQQQHHHTATQLQGERREGGRAVYGNDRSVSNQTLSPCVSPSAECATLQQRCVCLQQDCDNLRAERTALTNKLHRLETELSRYTHSHTCKCLI